MLASISSLTRRGLRARVALPVAALGRVAPLPGVRSSTHDGQPTRPSRSYRAARSYAVCCAFRGPDLKAQAVVSVPPFPALAALAPAVAAV